MLLLVGCGVPAATPTPIPPTDTPTVIPPTRKPTSDTLPEYDPNTILVTFYGDECIASVPTELPVGERQFVIRDLSEDHPEFELWVSHLHKDHTYQDLLDMQSEPGAPVEKPSWATQARKELLEGTRNWPMDKVYIFYIFRKGEYAIMTGSNDPASLWNCGSFHAVEAPSE
jgi:hypothetical protein